MAGQTDTKHTPTPWRVFVDLDSVDLMTKHGLHIATLEPENAQANAAFVVRACNNIERVEAENAELKVILSAIDKAFPAGAARDRYGRYLETGDMEPLRNLAIKYKVAPSYDAQEQAGRIVRAALAKAQEGAA